MKIYLIPLSNIFFSYTFKMYILTNVVYYDSDSKFKIYPTLRDNDKIQFNKFIQTLRNIYNKKYNNETFFWKYDNIDTITINNYDYVAENKIYSQLRKLIMWLYENNYTVEGEYCGRINSHIEYIKIDSDNKMINYHILYDDKKNYFFGLSNNNELGSKIIINAKKNIDDALIKYHQKYNIDTSTSLTKKKYFRIPVMIISLIAVTFIFWPSQNLYKLSRLN